MHDLVQKLTALEDKIGVLENSIELLKQDLEQKNATIKNYEKLEEKIDLLLGRLDGNSLTSQSQDVYYQNVNHQENINSFDNGKTTLRDNINRNVDTGQINRDIDRADNSKDMPNFDRATVGNQNRNVNRQGQNNSQNQKRPLIRKINKENKNPKVKKEKNYNEAMIGKYIVGALAALLLFISAGSLIAIVWRTLTPSTRLSMILGAGLILTLIGYIKILKNKNPIFAVLLGAGAGLIYIGIISANLAFGMIDSNMTLFLCLLWSIVFMLTSIKIDMFFMTVIAYIGAICTVILANSVSKREEDILIISVFGLIVIATMMVITYKKYRKYTLISLQMSYFMLLIINFAIVASRFLSYTDNYKKSSEVIISIAMFVLLNAIYREKNIIRKNIGSTANALLMLFLLFMNTMDFSFELSSMLAVICLVCLIQFIIINKLFKNIKQYDVIYLVIMALTIPFINDEKLGIKMGISILAIVVYGIYKVLKDERYLKTPFLLIIADIIFGYNFVFGSSHYVKTEGMVLFVITTVMIIFLTYLTVQIYKIRDGKMLMTAKNLGLFAITSYVIFNFNTLVGDNPSQAEIIRCVAYVILAVIFILAVYTGFFKDWMNEKFNFKSHKDLPMDKNMAPAFYISTSLLIYSGMSVILRNDDGNNFLPYIYTLFTIAISLIQTSELMKNKDSKNYVFHIYIGIKYLVLTFCILHGIANLEITSFAYNIAGLVVAVVFIWIGFKVNVKGFREYGLALTILTVLKFIVVDMRGENSIKRVIAFIVGAILCFIISFIYNMLSEKYLKKHEEYRESQEQNYENKNEGFENEYDIEFSNQKVNQNVEVDVSSDGQIQDDEWYK